MFWKLKSPSSKLLLLLHAVALIQGQTISDDEPAELLPSDVPVTMSERMAKEQDEVLLEFIELETALGTITGVKQPTRPPHYDNTHMHSFRGIPYAKAPTGDLRFVDPVDLMDPWAEGRLSAIKLQSFCPQYDAESKQVLGNEDCLYLNIYTPSHLGEENRAEGPLLPVLFFIHGGGFIRGSSSSHGASKILSRDVIVVTMNYRLGVLGYLSMGDSILPGNYGFLDQVSALRWVQRNIAQFGGDPNLVTIGGFSAGAACVHLHMHSPLSQSLFHRAIIMSGAATCPWATNPHPKVPARLFAEKIGCPSDSSKSLRECVSSKSFDQIAIAQAAIYRYEFYPVWFSASTDGGLRSSPFLPAPLEELELQPKPSLISVVPHEGLLFASLMLLRSENVHNSTALYDELARYVFASWPDPDTEETMKDLAEALYYSKHARTSQDILLEQIVEAISDHYFLYCGWKSASSIAESGAPVYVTAMTHRDANSPTWSGHLYERVKKLGFKTAVIDTHISHGDDILYLFDFPYLVKEESSKDHRVGQMILQMWTNFVMTGNPQEELNRFSLGDIPKWEQLVPDQPVSYYNIAVEPSMKYRPIHEKEMNFWENIVPSPGSTHGLQASQILKGVKKQSIKTECQLDQNCDLSP